MNDIPNTFRQFSWRTSVHSVTVDDITWECWDEWCWTWQWCWPRYELFWYDGPFRTWHLGFATLATYSDSTYRETH